jgi:hypothetical protein
MPWFLQSLPGFANNQLRDIKIFNIDINMRFQQKPDENKRPPILSLLCRSPLYKILIVRFIGEANEARSAKSLILGNFDRHCRRKI